MAQEDQGPHTTLGLDAEESNPATFSSRRDRDEELQDAMPTPSPSASPSFIRKNVTPNMFSTPREQII